MKTRVFIAGHNGMVGAAIVRQLKAHADTELLTRSRSELDLCSQTAVAEFFAQQAIDVVYLCAAKVGGIFANSNFPADFIYENLMLEANVIHQAYAHNVSKLLFLGSSCIYPRLAPQPMQENALLTGPLEPTNEPYALAKIAGLKLCESYNRQYGMDYRSVMPTNLFGPGDNFHNEHSHVIPALLRRFHEAKKTNADTVTIWGSGSPRREFLHVDDMACASVRVMGLSQSNYASVTLEQGSHINIGSGVDHTIAEVASTIAKVTGFKGEICFDTSKPDGAPRKLMDSGKILSVGWKPRYTLQSGLENAYQWYLDNQSTARH